MPKAIIDAAIVYGAARHFHGLHHSSDWMYAQKYKPVDDEALFFEMLHSMLIYDRIILDKSSLEHKVAREIKSFVEQINFHAGRELVSFEDVGTPADVEQDGSRHYFCAMLAQIHEKDQGLVERACEVKIPWAYTNGQHHDQSYFDSKFDQFNLPNELIPFSIYCWRAVTYEALSNFKSKATGESFAYTAAPGRLNALEILFNANFMAKIRLPRDLLRQMHWGIPQFPGGGYDFTFVEDLPFSLTSPITYSLMELQPARAIERIGDIVRAEEALSLKEEWRDLLFSASRCAFVGRSNIQIMRNVTSSGDVSQNQYVIARPDDTRDVFKP